MFRTEVFPEPSNNKLNHNSNIISFGSCFAESIGSKLKKNKFNISINPFGIIYNPISIFDLLSEILNNTVNFETSIVENKEIWNSLLLHSKFSSLTKSELISNFNAIQQELVIQLQESDTLIFTFGSAFIYKHIEKNIDVANCHKISSKEFKKRLLTINEISSSFNKFISILKKANKAVNIIFTVSPIRHLRDGLENNSLSKSTLRIAINKIQEEHLNTYYFPSFELLIDDLRDYRYYKNDLLHPTPFAENYIWNKFQNTFFDSQSKQTLDEFQNLNSSINHRPFNPKSDEHQLFLKKLLKKLEEFTLDCTEEIEIIKEQIL